MGVVTTLRRKSTAKTIRKEGSSLSRLKFDFDGKLEDFIEKIIEHNNQEYDLPMQILSAKEIEALLQKNFQIFKFEVSEVEVETSKKISSQFALERYNREPKSNDTKTFLDDLYEYPDIKIQDEDKKSWSKTKIKVALSERSKYCQSKDKEYLLGNTPKAIKINIKKDGKNLLNRPIFTLPGLKINKVTREKLYKNVAIGGKYRAISEYASRDYAEDNKYKILDLNYVVSMGILLESCFKYIDRDVSFLYNSSGSYYGKEYTVEDFMNLLNVGFLTSHKDFLNEKIMSLICECVIAVTHTQSSEVLNRKYQKELVSEYSKSFETKRNIPSKQKEAMKNNKFLEYFNFVELDELTDIEKFYAIENEFELVRDSLQLNRFLIKNSELRFRRLGQHKADGLYYPHNMCICIDINSPSSFIHQLGHHIDHTTESNGDMSSKSEFRLLAIEYKRELENTLTSLSETQIIDENHYKRKRGYFHTPTEIFARCLEIYLLISKEMTSSFLPSRESLTLCEGYPNLTESLLNKINDYFDNIFNIAAGINTTTSGAEQMLLGFVPTSTDEYSPQIISQENNSNVVSEEQEDNSVSDDNDIVREDLIQVPDITIETMNSIMNLISNEPVTFDIEGTLEVAASTDNTGIDIRDDSEITIVDPTTISELTNNVDIVAEHDADGANYFFRIINEAVSDCSNAPAYRPRRRRNRLNRAPVDENSNVVQESFF